MPPEPFPSRRRLAPEDGEAQAERPTGQLVEPSGEPYCWALADDDEDYRTLFGDASQALMLLPELGDVVASLAPETTVVADIPSFLQKQIDSGELAFQVDRSGESLAHLVDRGGRMRHVLRLDTRRLTPDLSQAWSDLRARAVQLEVMAGLRDLEEEVVALRAGLQDDRLALVDSAWSLIDQARTVSDSEHQNNLLHEALVNAVEARDKLNRSIGRDLDELAKQRGQSGVLPLVGQVVVLLQSRRSLTEKNAERAEQVLRSVAAMESATRAAALVHMHHDEPAAARTALGQFQALLAQRHLDDDVAFTELNSFARVDQKPLYARVLSSYARALEVCGVEPGAMPLLPLGDAGASTSTGQEDPASASGPVLACSECGKDIEAGETMCAYHRGKQREGNVARVVAGGVVVRAAVRYGPKLGSAALKTAGAVTKMIRL